MKGYVTAKRGRVTTPSSTRASTRSPEGAAPLASRRHRPCRSRAARPTARRPRRPRRNDEVRSLTFGAYLTGQWLPAKKLHLATSTYRGYERNVQRHVLPALGRIGLRRLRHHQIEALYDRLLAPHRAAGAWPPRPCTRSTSSSAAPSTDAVRRGLVTRNVALVARAPKQRAIRRSKAQSWTDEQLQPFLRAAAGHRLLPAPVARRHDRHAPQRGPRPQVGRHRLQAKRASRSTVGSSPSATSCTRPAARPATPDAASTSTTPPSRCSTGWRAFQAAEYAAVGIERRRVGVHRRRRPTHPPPRRVTRRSSGSPADAGVPVIRLHDLRHTHGTLLIKDGVPVKVVSERLGHAHIAFTIADLPARPPRHAAPTPPASIEAPHRDPFPRPIPTRWNAGGTAGGRPPEPGGTPRQRRRPRSLTWAFMLQLVAGVGFEPTTFGL